MTSKKLRLTYDQEGATKVINLKAIGSDQEDDDSACDDPEAVKLMIHYFYHLDYQAGFTSDVTRLLQQHPRLLPDGDELMHAKLFAAAVKYQIPALRNLAAAKFRMNAELNRSNGTFGETIRIVYTTTPEDVRELRDVVADLLMIYSSLLDREDIKAVVMDIDHLAWELLRKSKGLDAGMPGQVRGRCITFGTCFECKAKVYESGCDCGRVCLDCGWPCCPNCS